MSPLFGASVKRELTVCQVHEISKFGLIPTNTDRVLLNRAVSELESVVYSNQKA